MSFWCGTLSKTFLIKGNIDQDFSTDILTDYEKFQTSWLYSYDDEKRGKKHFRHNFKLKNTNILGKTLTWVWME